MSGEKARYGWLPGVFLAVATFIAYGPALHASFIWDDDAFLTNNPVILGANGLYRLWFTASTPDYYPMTSSMLWLEWRMWGNNPLGYHLVNVLLHAASAVLFWRVFQHLKFPGAALAAALFALHPVNVQSVAWITKRKNTLAMFFFAATLLCWLKFEEGNGRRWYGLALAGFAFGLLSKTAVVPLPFVLLGLAWWQRGRVGWGDVRRVIPFFALATALGLVTVWFQYHQSIGQVVVRTDSFWSRLAGASWAAWFYLYKAALPLNLLFVYPRWQIDAKNVLSWLPLALLAATFVVCWRCKRAGGRAVFFGLAYFVVMLLPTLGFLNIFFMRYTLVADYWQYFAIIGPLALAAAGIEMGLARARRKRPFLRPVVWTVLLIALGALTWCQCEIYADPGTLWEATLKGNPNCWLAHNNIGMILLEAGNLEDARAHFEKALAIEPDDASDHFNMGRVLIQTGQLDKAIAEFQEAIRCWPLYVAAHQGLGDALLKKGRLDEAITQYQNAAAAVRPDVPQVHCELGNALFQKGRIEEAIAQYRKALALDPDIAEVRYNLGFAFAQEGKLDEAIVELQKALAIQRDFAPAQAKLARIAWLLATSPNSSVRNGTKALELAQQADQLAGSGNPMIAGTLAAAYAETGRFTDAITNAERALQLATSQSNATMAKNIAAQLKSYQAGSPFRDSQKTP